MDPEQRTHNRTTTATTASGGGDLLICFASMKISSKSILSPGRTRDPAPASLSSSLSRRLRTNGSIKGGQASPMFPAAQGKKKGCAFENPEPSSPKVTCIGQVRVKTKKQGKKMRSRSRRRGSEASFRRAGDSSSAAATPCDGGQISRSFSQSHFNHQQQDRNQRWVHLPMTICEALRAFGSDFNCFLPCRSSCLSSSGEKTAGKPPDSGGGGGCGAAFARWLVAVQEGDDGKGREIEMVVGDEEEVVRSPELRRSQRRHVFEDIDIVLEEEKQSKVVMVEEEEEETEEARRVSVCVPPKNALLLMRCRSDPVKMAALANRFWESPLRKEDEQEEAPETEQCKDEEAEEADTVTVRLETEHCEDVDPEEEEEEKSVLALGDDETVDDLISETAFPEEKPDDLVTEEEKSPEIENRETEVSSAIEDCSLEERETEVVELELEETVLADSTPPEDLMIIVEQEIEETAENSAPEFEEEEEDVDVEENRASVPSSPFASVQSDPESEPEPEPDPDSENSEAEEEEKPVIEAQVSATMEEPVIETEAEMEEPREDERPEPESEPENEPGRRSNDSVSSQTQKLLPDCLLLMMCEPKLSMEVSKETWVCSTDFIRRLPERPPQVNTKVTTTNAPDEPTHRNSTDSSNPPPLHQIRPYPLHQPPRSSCSFPAPAQPSPGSKPAHEPLALKRCKSEPMRSPSKLALPEAAVVGCFWNNRRLEPIPGATGVGC